VAKIVYKNCNPFPVVIPGPSSTGVLVAPGQFVENPWFSRFCGPKQLTAVPFVGLRSAPRDRVIPPPVGPPPPLPSMRGVEELVVEETKDYVYSRGVYNCKYCDLFRTGSRAAFVAHLQMVHKKPEAPPVEPIVEKPAVATPEEFSLQAEEPPPTVKPAPQPAPEGGEVAFVCLVCEKKFRSKGGLASHSRMHQKGR